MFRRKIVGYVSKVGRLLENFNKTQPKSESQLAEIKKHERIAQLRDEAKTQPIDDLLPTDFQGSN